MDVIITNSDCEIILQNYSKGAQFINYFLRSLAEDVEGYLASHFLLSINYLDSNNKNEIVNFFLKKPSNDMGFLTDLAQNLEVFKKEMWVYSFLKELEKMKNYKPFAPKCYLIKKDTLVIENLEDYEIMGKEVLYNLDQCKVALDTIALYHSTFIAYEKKQGDKYSLNETYKDEYEDKYYSIDQNSSTSKFFTASEKLIIDLFDILHFDQNLKELVSKEINEESNKAEYVKKYRMCTLHGDLWNKNIMFNKQDPSKNCRLVDFQLLRYYLPGYDVMLFLNANTSHTFREEHREELLQSYYKSLETHLNNFDVDCSKLIPYQDFLDGVLLSEPSAKIAAFNDTALMQLPQSLLIESFENPELLKEVLTEKRTEYILKVYEEDEKFREFVKEELTDLKVCLEKKQYFINNNTKL